MANALGASSRLLASAQRAAHALPWHSVVRMQSKSSSQPRVPWHNAKMSWQLLHAQLSQPPSLQE
jgi:hypothetical protein